MPDSTNSLMNKFYQAVVEGNVPLLGAIATTRAANGVEASTSTTANGSVTSPGADAAIATTATLPAGTWEIEAKTFITGTTVAALESDNMKFKIGATAVATIINPVPGTTGATDTGEIRMRVNLPAPSPVSVASGAAGTTGAVYKASIVANKVGY
ncbi:hypothetical protein [Streptomyces griseosporeus]|uniref:hypothetical protein n=1 Tax=Streptomyces griseosporeus TaxID=1910 RepID=UPI00167E1240|nr:hypothetical protein [Streptomyces griseosporeus]GHF92110.1 hypothetical protein GCM10018783_73680 [Streptomyces griseosporeus]